MTLTRIQQIIEYFKKNLSKGYTIESLKWALINQDYSKLEVEKAIELMNKELAEQAPKLIEKPEIKIERIPINTEKNPIIKQKKQGKKVWWKRNFLD